MNSSGGEGGIKTKGENESLSFYEYKEDGERISFFFEPRLPLTKQNKTQTINKNTNTKFCRQTFLFSIIFLLPPQTPQKGLKRELEKRTLLQGSVVVVDLDDVTVGAELSVLPLGDVLLAGELGESPLGGAEDFLTAGKFELSAAEGLDDVGLVGVLGADGDEDLADGDAGGDSDGLSVGVPHTGTETISSSARKHLIGAEDVEGVGAHADVVGVLSDGLGQVLVDGDAGGLEGLGGNLLLLVAHHVGDEGEEIDGGLLGADVVDADLGVGHTTAVPTLDVGLVLLVAVATAGAASHD